MDIGLAATRESGHVEKPGIDTKFTKEFTSMLKSRGLRTNSLPKASPNLSGRCERFIVFGKRHLDHLVSEFVEYYNHYLGHMEREHLPPVRREPEEVETLVMEQIEVKSYVGGLVKSFERKVA